jgi:hypothetical protein
MKAMLLYLTGLAALATGIGHLSHLGWGMATVGLGLIGAAMISYLAPRGVG